MNSWVRLWHDMPTDPKWRVIARKSGQPVVAVIAVFNLLMIAASCNATKRGGTDDFVSEDAAAALDLLPEDVESILSAMRGKVMDENGVLTGWEKRQPKREDSSTERVRAYRERQGNDAKRNETQRNAPEKIREDSEQNTPTDVGVAKQGKRGSRLTSDWKPSDEDLTFALQQGMTNEETRREADKFRDFWIAKPGSAGVKLDWSATWRNWCRNRRGEGSGTSGQPNAPRNGPKPTSMAGILAERRRQAEGENDVPADRWILREG